MLPVEVKLYHKTNWDSITFSLPKQLAVLQHQISNLISSENLDLINIINSATNILTDTIMSVHSHLPEETIKSNTSIPLSIQLLIRQKRKTKRAFVKSRSLFLKSPLNGISKKTLKSNKEPSECRYQKENSKSLAFKRPEKLKNSEKENELSEKRTFLSGFKK